jgi:hypothetical protein
VVMTSHQVLQVSHEITFLSLSQGLAP